ncbi:MFS transporter [Modestobacter sp. VKM Ac-2985]|uniref:MFS transporter n=1 Tax=Modestobacter sp. VKM Ac-2985 TaxID=3004139 RepID=UPI0022AB8987|nr:MFS transporter [Modestobacter sp. VKM Ac-2985]MCZ2837979.1 MFS transporter [Modestobacter sp. VKM Ac-2985]
MVGVSAVALAATAPGQTAAISAFIDPMTEELGISRSAISTAYLIGTLIGAAAMPLVGRALDRFGTRVTMAVIGAVFGGVLISLSLVSGLVGLTAGFVGVRMAGQGALGLTATTAVAVWFIRRRGLALGLVSASGAACISLAPIGLEALISATSWRTAWAVEGVVVWLLVVPLALFGVRNDPAELGQRPDGEQVTEGHPPAAPVGRTLGEAVRTPFFWVVVSGVAVSGMLSTGVAFHQIDLLGERGLSAGAAAANFLPQTVASLLATLAVGALVDRVNSRWLTSACMLALAAALLWGTSVDPGWSAIGFGALLGASAGAIRTLEAGSFPRYYGTTHLGTIRGVVAAVSVGSTAFGPVAFAVVHDATGGYGPALVAGAALPLLVALAALVFPTPALPEPAPADPTPEDSPPPVDAAPTVDPLPPVEDPTAAPEDTGSAATAAGRPQADPG